MKREEKDEANTIQQMLHLDSRATVFVLFVCFLSFRRGSKEKDDDLDSPQIRGQIYSAVCYTALMASLGFGAKATSFRKVF